MKKLGSTLLLVALLSIHFVPLNAQPTLQNDYSYSMESSSVIAMESSPAHMYVLSDNEGIAVFRTRGDSLQWLYTTAGMQQRGNTIETDIRFAYLFGNSRRLTVLEPTSVMGAYSSTNLPARPLDVARFNDKLYVALGEDGLGILNLETPETLDSGMRSVEASQLQGQNIIAIETLPDKLYALSANGTFFVFSKNESSISFDEKVTISQNLNRLFYINNTLWGTSEDGRIFEISDDGSLSALGSIGEPVKEIRAWNDWLLIKGNSNRIWSSYQLTEPTLWKQNGDAGNYLAVSKGQLWLSEYDRISRVSEVSEPTGGQVSAQPSGGQSSGELKIQSIPDQVIPYPQVLLIPLRLEGRNTPQNVRFSLDSDVKDAKVRGQSLYWKPESNDKGEHHFKVVASTPYGQTSSTSFTVDVQAFNSPPRFTPLRTISIPVDREFTLPIKAIDPDGTNKNLIRYLGVNLPNGATIDEQTGEFRWTPTSRQEGENSFRVIATDQYGAASSANVTIRVIETNSGGN